jgi:hypothetical protein
MSQHGATASSPTFAPEVTEDLLLGGRTVRRAFLETLAISASRGDCIPVDDTPPSWRVSMLEIVLPPYCWIFMIV